MSASMTPALQAMNSLAAGLWRVPTAMLFVATAMIAAEIARRALSDIAGCISFIKLPDSTQKGTLAYYAANCIPPLVRRSFNALADKELGYVQLTKDLVVTALFANVSWAVAGVLFGPPSPVYNNVLRYLGPLKLDMGYVHPVVKLFSRG